jgi:outer membrane cobalamin receptor
VLDEKTKEPLIGAIVVIKGTNVGAPVSLSGNFKLTVKAPGTYTLVCSFVSYESLEKTIVISNEEKVNIDFELKQNTAELSEVVVTGVTDKTTDEFALHTEKNSESIVNVMSAKMIQLMPDITVANLLQRFSGVSVDRNASGDAQYAIIRGMPQRYNYTLVNGIKIPSPDDKNRYVPMDLFPADLLDRLEVIKALTPSMEGDAAGGGMNMVMKDAPGSFTVNASAATGTNVLAAQRGFTTFSGWQEKAPVETHGAEYLATPYDFTYKNFQY